MPAFSTHYIFSSELIESISKISDFTLNKDALLIGAQGPDIFFFHRIFPWQIGKSLHRLGSKMHRTKPSEILEAMRIYCEKSANQSISKSYAYGFITHYALDSICHPYIYSLQNKIVSEGFFKNSHTVHNAIEFSIDSYMLNKHLKIEKPYAFNTEETVSKNPEVLNEIGRLYAFIISRLYNKRVSEQKIVTAVYDTAYVQRLTLDKRAVKRALLTPVELLLAPLTHNYKLTAMLRPRDLEKAGKYVNIEKRMWKYPAADIECDKSFDELFELAKPAALNIIKAFNNNMSLKNATKDKSFLTGVEEIENNTKLSD